MIEILTGAQMRAIEDAAIAAGRVDAATLMERAGAGVVAAIGAFWPQAAPLGRAVVVCGPGANGGDGYVVARLLASAGWAVEALSWGAPDRAPEAARMMRGLWTGPVQALDRILPEEIGPVDLVVDALFGIGLDRPPPHLPAMDWLCRGSGARVVAVDLPSCLSSESGRNLGLGPGWPADLTVTFHRAKTGHFLADGPDLCGRLQLVDIGLEECAAPAGTVRAAVAGGAGLAKGARGHKFDYGHALILGGGAGRGGAARLAARAALRIGAGLVTLAPPPEALAENAARLDAVMLSPLTDGDGLARMLEDPRITALALGPGLGLGAREAALVAAALRSRRPMVLDADALSLIARDPALFALLHGGCVLTPHGGEFARLFPDLAERLQRDPLYPKNEAARAAAARSGAVVLFKGADTVIAAPDGDCRIHAAAYGRAAPWLATAGSGDVLAGLIAGLLAREHAPLEAASTGAWLHCAAALDFGPGLIAEDLPERIPAVLRGLGA